MDGIFLEIVKSSPMLGLMLVFWYYTRKDFTEFVSRVQTENAGRELKYQETISNLTKQVGVVEIIKSDVEEIKEKLK